MKTNVVSTFYTNYSTLVQSFHDSMEYFKRIKKYYDAVALGSLITDGSDFGVSAETYPKLLPFFDDLKSATSDLLDALNAHIEQNAIYVALGLSSEIDDADDMGDGVTGAELKAAISSMSALDGELTSAFHYTNLYKIKYTAKRASADWRPGILGSEVEAVMTSMAAADTYLTTNFHYTNLDKLL